jgi:hypothetical protein
MNADARPPHGLKFHWPQRSPVSLALVGFLILSVLAHGLAFYILQVVDPPGVRIPPPSVEVNLLTPSTPENRALLQWIEAEDPAAIANTHEIVPGSLYVLSYERSATEIHATPKSPEEEESAVQFPPAEETMAVIGGAQEAAPAPVAGMPPLPTELRFSGGLAGRKITKQPPLKFSAPAPPGGGFEATSFMVGVGPDGKVLYLFSMANETDDNAKKIERQGEDFLEKIEFSREAGGIAWGIATYYWGNDSYQPEAAKP